ncbi:MAG: hypothetical protein JSR76_01330 [Verrucomicrobia bacterium]|nr:hypothetical protein [Verrucomicrobiota bacterium]
MVSPMSADMRAARRVSPPLARPPQPAHAPNPPRVPSPLTMRGADVPPPARGRRPPPLSQRALSEYAESGDALRDQLVGMARFGISSQLSPESLAQQRRLWSQQDLITARREAGIPPTPPPTPPRSPSVRMVYDSPPSSPIRPSVWAPTTSPETRPTGGFLTPSGRLTPQRREAIFRQFPDLRRLYHQDT